MLNVMFIAAVRKRDSFFSLSPVDHCQIMILLLFIFVTKEGTISTSIYLMCVTFLQRVKKQQTFSSILS